jgi:hypothetical protein
MLELARSPAPADRARLLMALAELCERDGVTMAPETQAMVGASGWRNGSPTPPGRHMPWW